MALFCSSVGTLYLLLPELALPSGWAVAPLRCCQPKKLGASLVKAYSPECVEGVFSEVRLARRTRFTPPSPPTPTTTSPVRKALARTNPTAPGPRATAHLG